MSFLNELQSGFLRKAICLLALQLSLYGTFGPDYAVAQNATTAGTATAPFPTIENLSIDWPIAGDDNNNGSVAVRYRQSGQTDWTDSAPLRRVPAGSNAGFSWANKHSGSITRVAAGTSYEIELALTDPDGGSATQTISASTRTWPGSSDQATEVVTPATIAAALANVSPGDVLVLADGNYSGINVFANGTLAEPIVVRAQNFGGAVVNGDIRFDGFGFIHIVGLTVEGQIKFNGSNDIVIRDCLIITDRDGIVSFGAGVSDSLIKDNTVIGPTQWNEPALGNSGNNLGEGIVLTGPGNVIAFNRVEGFRDGISLLEDSDAVNQQSIDIYGNDIYRCGDDGIEADFGMGNVRVHHNRVTDCFIALSSQPSLGGPTYFYRNVVYNAVYQAFKPQRSSDGNLWYHNTIVKPGDAFNVITSNGFSRSVSRNNIFIGGPAGTFNGFSNGAGRVLYLPSADATCDFNYDGFGSSGTGSFVGRIGATNFDGLAQMQALTTETDAVELDLSVFEDSVSVPAIPVEEHSPPSFELAAQSSAIDVGVALTGFNDRFTGTAPDLGAYEFGKPIPVYGPGGNLGVEDEVVNRFVFYNESRFDGDDASANAADFDAAASDKQALLPGQTATFANYTSYVKGINGVIFEIPATSDVSRSDFEFRIGNDNNVAKWESAPEPTSVTFTARMGGAPNRVTVVWPNGAIVNTWLEIKILANANTGLSVEDVSYFGNLIGETGDSPTAARTNATDIGRLRNNLSGFFTVGVENAFDIDRSGRVNANDIGIARNNLSGFSSLSLITP
ncbi:right-handed parallel beta-helix repeat-containing protein [Mariniblastus fucicola]|uniref:Probable pectate lyase C n=1 Tax=Mariniblastus fucicola TaxID=980251 RepID=A0A5B9PIM3_9BACT|nr:right-handed parallel beta-helix repeat-containing protein [Mariniblastus fucicola]QEG22601.1 hypothetical protein MFFC18_24840 [Mariniblastus fucicola]